MTPQEHRELIKAQIKTSYNDLEKGGREAVIGEVRMFGNKPYIKTNAGWRPHNQAHSTAQKPTVKKTSGEKEWWSEFSHLKLNAYPLGVPRDQVKVNTEGDIDSHAVMTWKDPKTGQTKNAYTKEFLNRNAQVKWQRISKISDKKINTIKDKSLQLLASKKADAATKDAAAIIAIIANTGLRRGNKGREAVTGNKGVSTLSPENITIEGSKIHFNFIGKSYKENNATIDNEVLAQYLQQRKQVGDEYLFDTTDSKIDSVFDEVGGKGLKIKDMRTYVACDLAKHILYNDEHMPPPIPPDVPKAKIKKLVQDKLKSVYQQVSDRLNNTPTMAKTSYIHPHIIDSWLTKLNLPFEFAKSEAVVKLQEPSMEELFNQFPPSNKTLTIQDQDEEECDEYNVHQILNDYDSF